MDSFLGPRFLGSLSLLSFIYSHKRINSFLTSSLSYNTLFKAKCQSQHIQSSALSNHFPNNYSISSLKISQEQFYQTFCHSLTWISILPTLICIFTTNCLTSKTLPQTSGIGYSSNPF